MATSCEIKGLASDTLGKLVPRTDKLALTRAFVDSQRRHTSEYTAEGKREFSRWKESQGLVDSAQPCKPAQNPKTTPASGFSSPILKPRNANCPSLVQPSIFTSLEDKSAPKRKGMRGAIAQQEAGKHVEVQSNKTSRKRTKESESRCTERRSGREKSKSPKKSGRKRRQRSDSDSEREDRLAQRRARRRLKKEIIEPKTREVELTSDSGDEVEQATASKRAMSKKKDKKSKLPAGLALMHGFTAENIGRHRLTMGPAATSGVFNKGRASTKAKVEKRKAAKAPATFDELNFLNRTMPSSGESRTPKHVAIRADSDSSPETNEPSNNRRKTAHHQALASTEPSCSPSTASSRTSSPVPLETKQTVCREESNYESQVWEIEKEFLQDVDDQERAALIGKPGSVVIDSTAWDWGVFRMHEGADNCISVPTIADKGREDSDSERSSLAKSVATITPSQSVSRIAARHPTLPKTETKSKFFAPSEQNKKNVQGAPHEQPNLRSRPQGGYASHGGVECKKDGVLYEPNEKVRCTEVTAEVSPVQIQTKEYRNTNESSCSLEDAIKRLEAGDLGPRSNQPGIPRERLCLSVLDTGLTPEDSCESVNTVQDELELIYLDALGFKVQQVYDTFDTCSVVDGRPEDHQTDLDNLPQSQDYEVQDFQAQTSNQNVSGFDDFEVPVDDYCVSYGYDGAIADSVHDTHLESDLQFSEDASYSHCRYPENLMTHEFHDYVDELYLTAPDDWEGSTYSITTSNGDHESIYSDELQEDEFCGRSGSEVAEDLFVRGRMLLLNADNMKRTLKSKSRSISASRKASVPVSSLEEAEAAVAKEFQKSFYPIRF